MCLWGGYIYLNNDRHFWDGGPTNDDDDDDNGDNNDDNDDHHHHMYTTHIHLNIFPCIRSRPYCCRLCRTAIRRVREQTRETYKQRSRAWRKYTQEKGLTSRYLPLWLWMANKGVVCCCCCVVAFISPIDHRTFWKHMDARPCTLWCATAISLFPTILEHDSIAISTANSKERKRKKYHTWCHQSPAFSSLIFIFILFSKIMIVI